nr:hypothetical protein [Tanacetum cinerariifolium]
MAKQQNPQQTPPQSPPHQHEQQEDQPESPRTSIPYDPAPQVDYSLDLINIKTTNEVATLYPEHNNSEYFKLGSKALKTTLQTRELGPEGTKPRAKSGYRKKIPVLMQSHLASNAFIITEMKELPSKVNEINRAVGDLKHYIEKLEIKVPSDLKALLDKLEEIQTSILALANKVAFLEDFRLEILAGLLALLGQTTLQTEGEQIRDKRKKALSHEEVAEEMTNTDSYTESRPTGTLEESTKSKPLVKFTYITEKGEDYQMTEEEIKKKRA